MSNNNVLYGGLRERIFTVCLALKNYTLHFAVGPECARRKYISVILETWDKTGICVPIINQILKCDS